MGRDVTCPVTVDGETRTARVLLETGEIIIQGRPRLKVAFRDMKGLIRARNAVAPDGMIWVVWPKGRKEFGEDHVRRAALAAGLVDVKVAAFDERLSALKLVIPVRQRGTA